jgi:hypothetical protein
MKKQNYGVSFIFLPNSNLYHERLLLGMPWYEETELWCQLHFSAKFENAQK